ncbi:MAG: prepilin peptidase [Candidatus Poribacteria bacterium]|nr:prepilin peptidase [Candidatus Poribacteria bacterium]
MVAIPILIFILGLIIGSFLNVCIYRIPRDGLSVHFPGISFCPECRTRIRAYDNIPVLSYLILRGRCRHCGAQISIVYPLVELMTGGLFLLLFYRFGLTFELLHACLFVTLLVPIAWIDAKWYIIPNAIILFGLITGSAVTVLISLTDHDLYYMIECLIGAIAGGAALALLATVGSFLFRKQAMGAGDIKLMMLIGLFLGAWPHLLIVLIASAFIGSLAGVLLIILGAKEGPQSAIPYGPFLVIGALLDLLWGNAVWEWYLKLIGLQ